MSGLKEIEERIRKHWENNKIPEKMLKLDKEKKFFLLDGPPYANAEPHVGHLKTIVSKDVWIRFKRMSGFSVYTIPGFDCHGLPVEVKVESKLGIKNKKEIETKIGTEKFIEECRKYAVSNVDRWMEVYKRIGAVKGWFSPYLTLENYYIDSAWWMFKQMWDKGLVYKKNKPIFWCPHCQTSLAGYEVTDSYADLKDPSIYVKFPVKGKKNEYILVWTTTPWTLVGNVAIVVHPDEKYVKVKYNGEYYILAKARVRFVFEEKLGTKDYEIVEEFLGKDLDGLEYEPVLDVEIQKDPKIPHKVVLSVKLLKKKSYSKKAVKEESEESEDAYEHMVSMEEGSGCVHVAPGHGPEDYELSLHYNLPIISPVDEEGRYTKEAGKYAGLKVREANEMIISDLKKDGKLLLEEKITHKYPLCWRCKTPLIFRSSEQWFISVKPLKEKMLEANESVNWYPEFGKEMFMHWLEKAEDWCISRQRYWGIPIPIWVCENGHVHVVSSKSELEKLSGQKIDDLHRNVVDKITFKCPVCGKEMKRIPDIFDVWFDSGVAPTASFGYPYKNKELFEKLWPVDMVNESLDQIRGWFYSLMFANMAALGESPYKSVSMMGWVVDEKGEKMSKSLGNVVWAIEALEKYPSDALRIYYCYTSPMWEVQKFVPKELDEIKKKIIIYLNIPNLIEEYKPENFEYIEQRDNLTVLDKWLLSRLNRMIRDVKRYYENFNFHKVGRTIIDFLVEDLSRFYIKAVRKELSKRGDVIIRVILESLMKSMKMLAPVAPYSTEAVYQKIKHYFGEDAESIHLTYFPQHEENLIDDKLEEEKTIVTRIIETALLLRNKQKIRLRWPLRNLTIYTEDEEIVNMVNRWKNVIANYTNVKEVIATTNRIEERGFAKASTEYGTVFLDVNITEELKEEAMISELIRKIQDMRKKAMLKRKDKIELYLETDEKTREIIEKFISKVKEAVNAVEIKYTEGGSYKSKLNFEDRTIVIGLDTK